jgi:hypothetical protein
MSAPLSSPEAIIAFSTGATSLLKKMGVSGNWLILSCFLAGGFATYMTTYQPALWSSLLGLTASSGIIGTGNVALLIDLVERATGIGQAQVAA